LSKIGDGFNAWGNLPYAFGGLANATNKKFLETKDQRGAWLGWREAVKNMSNEHIRWLALGDSITEGTGSTGGYVNTWVHKVAANIRSAYPNVTGNSYNEQMGWLPITQTSSSVPSVWTAAANGGSFNSASNFGLRHTKSTAITNGATLTATVTGTHLNVWWTQGTATTAFTVKVNGVVKATWGGSSASVSSGFNNTLTLGSSETVPGTYTVVITAGTGSSFINGALVSTNSQNSGVRHFNAAVHGWKTSEWVTATNHANWRQDYTTARPHLITLMLGANDYSSLVGLDTFKANLTTIVTNLRAQTKPWVYPTILLMSCYKEDYTFEPSWLYYEAGMEQVANEMGCAFLNLRDHMPDPGSAEAITQGLYAEAIHPNNTGYQRIADVVTELLLARAT
jgi:lysophospholipase L1-like esterase